MSEYGLRQQDYETIKALKQELADLRARLEKVGRDAERYRVIFESDKRYAVCVWNSITWLPCVSKAAADYTLDAAIDKERT